MPWQAGAAQGRESLTRLLTVLAVLGCYSLATGTAQAQLVLTLDPPAGQGGGVFLYTGTIENQSAGPIDLTDPPVLSVPGGVIAEDLFSAILPLNLPGNSSFGPTDFFKLTVPSGFAGGTGTYTVPGVDASGAPVSSNTVTFDIPGVTASVPEPGGVALLMSMSGAAGLALFRKRKA